MRKDANKNESWKRENTQRVTIRLQNRTDADILDYLRLASQRGESVQGAIKAAIRRDLEANRKDPLAELDRLKREQGENEAENG